MKRTYSKYGHLEFGEMRDMNIDKIIKEIKSDEVKKDYDAKVFERLSKATHSSKLYLGHKKESLRTINIRTVERVRSLIDDSPSAARYQVDYSAVFEKAPSLTISKVDTIKTRTYEKSTMGEMIHSFTHSLRDTEFIQENPIEETSDISDPTTLSQPYSSFEGPKYHNPGVISNSGHSDQWMKTTDTPGPSFNPTKQKTSTKIAISFANQSSRVTQKEVGGDLRDTRSGLDAIRPRSPQSIPFDKQSGRTPPKVKKKKHWFDDDNDNNLNNQTDQTNIYSARRRSKSALVKRRKEPQPFSKQTSYFDKNPFHHIMRPENEPTTELNTDRYYEYAFPKKSFDISQPGFKERTLYQESSAPDVIYPNVAEEYLKTARSSGRPPSMASMSSRKSVYQYMPRPEGEGQYSRPTSTLSGRGSVQLEKMGERNVS